MVKLLLNADVFLLASRSYRSGVVRKNDSDYLIVVFFTKQGESNKIQ